MADDAAAPDPDDRTGTDPASGNDPTPGTGARPPRTGPERARRRRPLRTLVRVVLVLALLAAGGVIAFLALTRDPEPGDFYDPPDEIAEPPGTVLRSEPFDRGVPAGAEAWRILYASTDDAGRPIAVSGLVIAPVDPPPGPRPVLAWAHGTTGIARPCAPSNTAAPLDGIPDLTAAIAAGWVITLTDYPGLGTPGPHPYLVQEVAAHAVLDSVTAAHDLDALDDRGLTLDDRFAIWGHSQGGHSALAAGALADERLPDQELVGVAALAPATDLGGNLAAVAGTQAGGFLTVLAVEAWTAHYPELPDDTLTAAARGPARRLAAACLNQPSRFRALLAALRLPDDLLTVDPTTDPAWTARLRENSPSPADIDAPLFVGQGLADTIIDAGVTRRWVEARCTAQQPTAWTGYEGLDHLAVVGPGGVDAQAWTAERFAGAAAVDACPGA